MKPNGVQVEWSAFGIHLRFIGVSNVTGNRANAVALSGNPAAFQSAKLLTN
jgi:hypothetical protein